MRAHGTPQLDAKSSHCCAPQCAPSLRRRFAVEYRKPRSNRWLLMDEFQTAYAPPGRQVVATSHRPYAAAVRKPWTR